ncbi:hypothetical protein [Clostridium estertheticum]|uniref:Uncharacterized protein n=1 Tax=Clostridium estertheticum TaxID=238834 RepID=A0A5N7IUX2_9CLOT|nr:hypothetical protein [Clostridium estertheticum]MBU3218327.1 hypothetical protein [Clostridium estertheticum]MBW9153903.1 hypothetical protein [Clostridium estertheticum]MBX4262681.1 hypothetical protein [Clostridium estertheticum]MBX4265593.1 hypothetical protein [Clostridium estertheticum]MBX4272011.1 hypothetical protein [Clostridium estertheticum]
MSDTVLIVLFLCVTILGLVSIISISEHSKDKLNVKAKLSIKNIADSEVAISSEDKECKK